ERLRNTAPDPQSKPKLADNNNDLLINWFSDGGICSNFPIQFFDAWLPKTPTFGINLAQLRVPARLSALETPRDLKAGANIAESIALSGQCCSAMKNMVVD